MKIVLTVLEAKDLDVLGNICKMRSYDYEAYCLQYYSDEDMLYLTLAEAEHIGLVIMLNGGSDANL